MAAKHRPDQPMTIQHVNGLAPYWRAAWQVDKKQNYFSVGVFGLNTKLQHDPSVPQEDKFNDVRRGCHLSIHGRQPQQLLRESLADS